MLTEKDIRALKGFPDTWYRVSLGMLILMTLIQAFDIYWSISLALDYGEAMGLDFSEILSMWNAEPELDRNYLGYEVQSLHRLNMAIISLGTTVILTLMIWGLVVTRSRNKRILFELTQTAATEIDNA